MKAITDLQRKAFMQSLSANVRSQNGLVLSDWESQFLGSWISSSRPSLWFTAGRRPVVDRMWMRYGPELNHPHPADRVSEGVRIDAADPDGCEYLLRDEGRQRRCNETAVLVGRRGLRYCQMHADEVVKAMRRQGKNIELNAFAAPAPVDRAAAAEPAREVVL